MCDPISGLGTENYDEAAERRQDIAGQINWLMVRAFNRVWNPIAEQLSILEECDAQFDGGEWSGPSNANHEQWVYGECIASVAMRFQIDPASLNEMLELAAHVSHDRFMEVIYAKQTHAAHGIEHCVHGMIASECQETHK
jgi:hypothetical protein